MQAAQLMQVNRARASGSSGQMTRPAQRLCWSEGWASVVTGAIPADGIPA